MCVCKRSVKCECVRSSKGDAKTVQKDEDAKSQYIMEEVQVSACVSVCVFVGVLSSFTTHTKIEHVRRL